MPRPRVCITGLEGVAAWMGVFVDRTLHAPRKRAAGAALADASNELWLSPISIWEFLVPAERGRLHVKQGSPHEWAEAALARAPMHDAPLSREVAIRSRSLRLPHEDPADRFLAATAEVYELTLVTSDERLLHVKGLRTLASR